MGSIRQPGFSSGELAPSMWGRTDSPRYATGLRRLYNFFVSKQGGAVTRAGTQFICTADELAVDGRSSFQITESLPAFYVTRGEKVRLIPFHFSDTDTTQNYVLIFGEKTIRILKNGAFYGGSDGGTATIYQTTAILYAQADLPKIQYVQSGDVLTITCAGYPPSTLTRGIDTFGAPQNDTSWVFKAIDFSRPTPTSCTPALDEGSYGAQDESHPLKQWTICVTQRLRDARGLIYETLPVKLISGFFKYGDPWNPNVNYKVGTTVLNTFADTIQYSTCLIANTGIPPADGVSWSLDSPTTPSPGEQTDSFGGGDNLNVVLYPDRPLTYRFYTGSPTLPANLVGYRVYRGLGGVFGWVGDSAGPTFVDVGNEPDYEICPPQGLNPLDVFDPTTGALLRTESPIAVAYYEDRLGFFGTKERPTFGFLSATGDYFNFDQRLVPLDSDSTVFSLSARKREIVRSALGKDRLFLLTNSGIWACGGSQGAPIGPSSIEAHLQVEIGSDLVAPLVVGDNLLWIRDKGTGVRSAAYDFARGTWTSKDLSFGSEHLVLGHRIVDWCFAEDPWGVAWAVRDDGVLLSLTYAPDEGLWAWAQHAVCVDDSGDGANGNGLGGALHSICTIPEGDEDAVYLAMEGAFSPWNAAVTYALFQVVIFNGFVYKSASNGNLNQQPPSDGTSNVWWSPEPAIGPSDWILRFSTRLEVPGLPLQPPIKAPICLDAYLNASATVPPNSGGVVTVVVSGLSMFEAREVIVVFSDGSRLGPLLVTGGTTSYSTTLPNGLVQVNPITFTVLVGLPYNCELELLDLPEGRTLQKVVNQVGLEVQAAGNVYVGSDFDHLFKHAPPNPAVDNLIRVNVRGTWNTGGRAALRVQDPIPVTVLGVTREVERGEG